MHSFPPVFSYLSSVIVCILLFCMLAVSAYAVLVDGIQADLVDECELGYSPVHEALVALKKEGTIMSP